MSGISIPDWLAYALFAALTLGVVAVLVWAVKRNEALGRERAARLRQVPGTGLWCESEPSFDLVRLARAYSLALDCLEPLWHRPIAAERLRGWTVRISPTETWKDARGEWRGGECFPRVSTIQVGPSLKVLAHELAHACESAVDRRMPDEAHATWAQRGIVQADNLYRTKWGKE